MDASILLLTRFVRLFAYGALSVVLVFHLKDLGLTDGETGLLLTLTLAGDTAISLLLSTQADRIGRRRTLVFGSLLMIGAGIIFAITHEYWLLLVAGVLGVISPAGNEVGPFLPIEQAALSEVVTNRSRTKTFAWYTLIGSLATALGSLCGGFLPELVATTPTLSASANRSVVILYALLGVVLALAFSRLSPKAEVTQRQPDALQKRSVWGVESSRDVVLKLAGLFSLDAFAGGFVVQSLAAYWFYLRFGTDTAALGGIFFGANLLAGLSALLAVRLAARFGLVRTMVFTHLPSNVLLILVPLMPTLSLAITVLMVRFSISQMDVPTRQSYLMAVVPSEERSAAAGITGVARTAGAALAPVFVGFMFAYPRFMDSPFFIAGVLKIVYDLLLYRSFVSVRPPEEVPLEG